MGEKPLCTKTQLHMQHIRNTHNLTSVELSLNPSIRSRSIPSGTITATIGKAVGKKTFGSSIISTCPPTSNDRPSTGKGFFYDSS